MSEQEQLRSVIRFYETHPINEYEILEKLRADGIDLETLTEEVLKDYDQDHFGGLEAVDVLAEKAGIDASTRVLDVCSGMGGPARYLAHRLGCRVTGLDITESRHEAAMRLTALVGLEHLVDFRLGNALDMPFADATFDVVIGQEAFAHVPDKPRLIAECARVVRPGGIIAFTDILRRDGLKRGRIRTPARRHDLPVARNAGRLRAAAGPQRLRADRARRPERLVDRGPAGPARDVSLARGHDGRQVRRGAFPEMGCHLRVLRGAVRGRPAGRRPLRRAAQAVSLRFDFAELSATDRYKLLGGLIVPRPIALVTSHSPDGRVNAAPFSFFNVFAEEPPLVVLGLGISPLGGAKDTTLNIRDTGEFVVNLVDEPIAEAMNLCAIDFPPEISEIEVAGLDLAPSEAVAPPRIAPGAGQSGMPALRHAAAGARALSGDRRGARGARQGRHPRPGDAARRP